jgi:hypothetical protein
MLHQGLAFRSTNADFQSDVFGLAVRRERTGSPTGRTKNSEAQKVAETSALNQAVKLCVERWNNIPLSQST